jgi:hypothetical protein
MHSNIASVHELGDKRRISNVADAVIKQPISDEMVDIAHLSGGQIVQRQNAMAILNK